MRIGTDINIKTCKKEGYTIIDFKVSDLENKKNKSINPDAKIRVIQYYPDYLKYENPSAFNNFGQPYTMLDEIVTLESVWELYTKYKEGIENLIGDSISYPTDRYELLNLIDSIIAYLGEI